MAKKVDVVKLDRFNQPAGVIRAGVTEKEAVQIAKDWKRMYGGKTQIVLAGSNPWPFTEREVPASKPLKSGWSVGRASEEAYKAGYSGRVGFRDWLKSKKLEDRSQGQINLLARSYEDGMAKEDQDSRGKRGSGGYSGGGGHAGSGSGQVSSGALEKEVASALVNYGAGSGEAREAAREAVKGGGSFDAVFKRALDMVRHKQNPESPERIAELKHELSRLRAIAPLFSEGAISPTQYNRMGGHQRETYHKNVLRRYQVEDELAEASKSDEQRLKEQKATRRKKIEDRLLQLRSHLQDMNYIYVKPRLAEGKKVKPTIQRDIDMTNSEIEGLEDELRGLNPHSNSNPLGHGHWESFDSEAAAKQYARLMEGQGKSVTRHGKDVRVDEDNPARSGAQYRLAQAVLSGQSDAMPVSVARELVEKTPAALRNVWSKHNPIQDPNSSGQGYDPDHHSPFDSTLSKYGYQYSHTTPVHYSSGVRMHHTFKKGNHNVSVEKDDHGEWKWNAGYGGSGRGRSGRYASDLDKYLAGVTKRKGNPEPAAADMYESFHGRPSEQIVTFEEDEHYHEYLAELGICCGVLVETVNGDVQAIGLSGFSWSGKGKNAGFLEEGQKSYQNPRRKKKSKVKGPFHQASDLILGGAGALDDKLGSVLSGNPDSNKKEAKETMYKGGHVWGVQDRTALRTHSDVERNAQAKYMVDTLVNYWGIPERLRKELQDTFERGYFDGLHNRRSKRNPTGDPIGPNTTLLSSNEDGTQLYLVGGDQSLDLDALGINGDMATKELVTIGDVCKIHYETEKDFDKFELIQYHHELGEETGDLPVLAYDRLNKRLLFIGGAYKIEKPWGETSPGIEN